MKKITAAVLLLSPGAVIAQNLTPVSYNNANIVYSNVVIIRSNNVQQSSVNNVNRSNGNNNIQFDRNRANQSLKNNVPQQAQKPAQQKYQLQQRKPIQNQIQSQQMVENQNKQVNPPQEIQSQQVNNMQLVVQVENDAPVNDNVNPVVPDNNGMSEETVYAVEDNIEPVMQQAQEFLSQKKSEVVIEKVVPAEKVREPLQIDFSALSLKKEKTNQVRLPEHHVNTKGKRYAQVKSFSVRHRLFARRHHKSHKGGKKFLLECPKF